MELDLSIWASCAQLYSLAETPQPPTHLRIWAHIRGALLVSKGRRHVSVIPWWYRTHNHWVAHENRLEEDRKKKTINKCIFPSSGLKYLISLPVPFFKNAG
jgi:hypothetical protein